ncbi:Protein of unknown function [Pyronema omphalodes CBS 100304]|uniref:Uncharacterized protein n=1 Tax=Pyronema omphalodes (strain CBS 100304) TaxID=1076935 RepID=U4L1R4_PYROM|nr:Protein of unknown function [Pyronema omphalodes CBS 100304]
MAAWPTGPSIPHLRPTCLLPVSYPTAQTTPRSEPALGSFSLLACTRFLATVVCNPDPRSSRAVGYHSNATPPRFPDLVFGSWLHACTAVQSRRCRVDRPQRRSETDSSAIGLDKDSVQFLRQSQTGHSCPAAQEDVLSSFVVVVVNSNNACSMRS